MYTPHQSSIAVLQKQTVRRLEMYNE